MCELLLEGHFELYVRIRQFIFLLAAFFSILSIFIVFKYSSQSLKNYKNILLVHLICFLVHDCLAGLLMVWRSYPNMLAYRQMGLLIHTNISLYVTLIPVGGLVTEILGVYHYMLIYRTQALLPEDHLLKMKGKVVTAFRIFSYNTWIIGVLIVLSLFSNTHEQKIKQLKNFDICSSFEDSILSKDVVVLNYAYANYATTIVVLGFGYMMIAYLISFCFCLDLTKRRKIFLSDKTKRLHKNLLMALFLQTFLPLTLIIFPAVVMYFGNNMVAEQISLICYGSHGLSNTISLVLAHKDYRVLLKEWSSKLICLNKKTSAAPSDYNSRNQR